MHTIELQAVSVRHRAEKVRSLKKWVIHGVRRRAAPADFYSLRDLTFLVERGESVGIIGANGAGKSTLLRVAAGITWPTSGVAIGRGSIVPLMELGTGFEAEFSGRENILFNGALLGRSRQHMRSQMDAIISFSGLEKFIDAPLRTYSTGMVARLAFAIATTADAETILLDEILAVGDAAFRQQCDQRIQSFVREGRTVVLVSHDTEALMKLCRRTVWMADGQAVADGSTPDVVRKYEAERPAGLPAPHGSR